MTENDIRAAALQSAVRTAAALDSLGLRPSYSVEKYILRTAKRYEQYIQTGSVEKPNQS